MTYIKTTISILPNKTIQFKDSEDESQILVIKNSDDSIQEIIPGSLEQIDICLHCFHDQVSHHPGLCAFASLLDPYLLTIGNTMAQDAKQKTWILKTIKATEVKI